jgi:preprotein translocase subunit SecA
VIAISYSQYLFCAKYQAFAATRDGAFFDALRVVRWNYGLPVFAFYQLPTTTSTTMDTLERIWELISQFFSGILTGFERAVTGMFGSSNAKVIKRFQSKVDAIKELESKFEKLSDEELREQTQKFRSRLAAGETLDDVLVEAFAVCREGGKRFLEMRHYDVQMIGGMVLHSGSIAEMVTGEGKTLVATLPAYLNAISGKGVHVVTVNDYLARRDMEWMAPLYMGLGLTVDAIQNDMSVAEKQAAYACDITYGTNNEFGFDYLRDNMRPAARGDDRFPKRYQQSQGRLNYAIIDEVDNILIDEARTPLIISGPAHQDPRKYAEADKVARSLKKELHFVVNEKDHNVTLTDVGVREAEKLAGVESFYTAGNMEWPHMIDNALKAHYLYKRDVNYVVKENAVVIVDEFTGRLMEGRQWSDGLHQAVEAKEGVKIKEETQTLATITLQNYFKLYDKICGMTGTAMTEANEFYKIYELDVIAIPTNREMQRIEFPDMIYATEAAKFKAVANDIERVNRYDIIELKRKGEELLGEIVSEDDDKIVIKQGKEKSEISRSDVAEIKRKGRPVLVGTVSIEKSERLSHLLDKRGIEHQVLNAKHHKREAEIVAQAGRAGAVTIATNMAGRGTDIVLGGNPETMAWAMLQDKYATRLDVPHEEWEALVTEIEIRDDMKKMGEDVKRRGGLYVIGTERHDARRIDLQLRGRCGRQGDPGSSRFFLSLEDDLMRIFAGPFVQKILASAGLKDDEAIESRMVTRRIESAQKKLEEKNFEIRKSLLEYDEVMDEQRKRVYRYRQQILNGVNCRELILDMIEEQVEHHLDICLARNFGAETFASWAGKKLSIQLDAKQFRGADIETATHQAKDEAERMAESEIHGKMEENLPDGDEDDTSDWNWEALTRFANARFEANLRDHDLKRVGRHEVAELLIVKAHQFILDMDLSEGETFLEEDFGLKSCVNWVRNKFAIQLDLDALRNKEPEEIKAMVLDQAKQKYDEKEAEYPVMAGLYRYARSSGASQAPIDRDGLVHWAASRFEAPISIEDLKNKQRDEIRGVLVNQSRQHQKQSKETLATLQQKVSSLAENGNIPLRVGNGAAASLSVWIKEKVKEDVQLDDLQDLEVEELSRKLETVVEDHYHPEMRRMERAVLLEIVDSAWKDHLLAMDYLKSAVGQRGIAAIDPKVEYKREGMRMFADLWTSIGERVTDLIFRMEQLNEDFVGSTWKETAATHAEAQSGSEIARQQQQAIDQTSGGRREPIRNRGEKVGRNDPCPCNSGKKYKNCCMRGERHAG